MTLLHLRDISLSNQGNLVLHDVSCVVPQGACIGIIGPNGCGKSSLLSIIAGKVNPGHGRVDKVKAYTIGHVPQVFPDTSRKTPLSMIGPYKSAYLGRFGIKKMLWDCPCSTLSGGEKTRLLLAMAFSENPDLLLLDEPTNHLDIPGIERLEKALREFHGTILIVSHDRQFLDSLCTGIWQIENYRVKSYSGGYSAYVQTREVEEAHRLKEYAKWQDRVQRLSKEVQDRRQWYDKAHKDAGQNDFLRRKAKKHARQAKAKEKRLEALLERKPESAAVARQVSVGLAASSYRTKTILRGQGFSFKYSASEPEIVKDARFRVSPGEKVALVGPNGCGKTTMIKLLAGILSPGTGSLWVNPAVQVGYLAQMLEGLDPGKTGAESVSKKTGRLVSEARNLLGYLGITGETQTLPLQKLSMGERTRVAIACLTFAPYDLLLLDEPTNHLDLIARETIEEALMAFPGAIIVATHDRFLIKRFCNTVWYLEHGELQVHQGTYQEFQEWRNTQGRSKALDVEGESLDRTLRDREARELAVRAKLAYLASQLVVATDAGVKAGLEAQYEQAVSELKRLAEVRLG